MLVSLFVISLRCPDRCYSNIANVLWQIRINFYFSFRYDFTEKGSCISNEKLISVLSLEGVVFMGVSPNFPCKVGFNTLSK